MSWALPQICEECGAFKLLVHKKQALFWALLPQLPFLFIVNYTFSLTLLKLSPKGQRYYYVQLGNIDSLHTRS